MGISYSLTLRHLSSLISELIIEYIFTYHLVYSETGMIRWYVYNHHNMTSLLLHTSTFNCTVITINVPVNYYNIQFGQISEMFNSLIA